MNGILVTAEAKVCPVGSREEIADPRQIDQDKKQDKRERQHNANLKYSVETAKLQLNYDILVEKRNHWETGSKRVAYVGSRGDRRNDGFISPAITEAGHGAADSCSSGKERGC